MKASIALVALLLLCTSHLHAQSPEVSLFVKGGASFYGALYIGEFGGGSGGGRAWWKTGPIIGAGAEVSVTKFLAFQGVVEFSSHHHKATEVSARLSNDPVNTIINDSGNAKLSWGPVYFLGGVAISHHHEDDVQWIWGSGVVATAPGRDETRLAGAIGLGAQFPLSDAVGFFVEGSARVRVYVTPVMEAGVSFKL